MLKKPTSFDRSHTISGTLIASIVLYWASLVSACPFCTALPNTVSDDLQEATTAVVAKCESVSLAADGIVRCKLRITEVIKGDPLLKDSMVEASANHKLPVGAPVWLVSFEEQSSSWAPPVNISSASVSYLKGLRTISENGPERLRFFLPFLQNTDEFVAADAYNEFAEATLEDIEGLKDQLDRQWVIDQLRDLSVPLHQRRLCWTFLSQCGKLKDTNLFDESVQARQADPQFEPGMNAAISCYVRLGGEAALARIERDYLVNPSAKFSDAFAAIHAIRVHGTELKIISRSRLARALRLALARSDLADLVIPDLARWKDWSAIGQVVELFQASNDENRLLKPTIVMYLKACPLPQASVALERLRRVDSKSVQDAESSMMLYPGLPSLPVPPPEIEGSSTSRPTQLHPKENE